MRFTLWAEGPSDPCLLPILTWLLRQCGVHDDIDTEEDEIFFTKKTNLTDIFQNEDYWSDLLFVQIDADSDKEESGRGPTERYDLCQQKITTTKNLPPAICVIPVQETETWLLVSQAALQQVTGTQKKSLGLPGCSGLEQIGNPKRRLCNLLRDLGQRVSEDEADTALWKKLPATIPLAEPQSYEVLRCLPSFRRLETAVKEVVQSQRLAYR